LRRAPGPNSWSPLALAGHRRSGLHAPKPNGVDDVAQREPSARRRKLREADGGAGGVGWGCSSRLRRRRRRHRRGRRRPRRRGVARVEGAQRVGKHGRELAEAQGHRALLDERHQVRQVHARVPVPVPDVEGPLRSGGGGGGAKC